MRTIKIENREEINNILKTCKTCYVAMADENVPYVLPMNFAMDEDRVVLHSAQHGRMWETLKKNPRVCINWTLGEELAWQDEQVGCSYRVKSKTINMEGTAEFIDDYNEKYRLLQVFMSQYSPMAFKFNRPAVENVGIILVHVDHLSAREFGAQAVTPWNKGK